VSDRPQHWDELRELAAQTYGFAERGRSTLDRVCDAWLGWQPGPAATVEASVIEDLGRDLVAQVFFDLHNLEMDSQTFEAFVLAVDAAAPGSIGSALLASFVAELHGDGTATRRHLDAVLAEEPNHGTAVLRSMILAIDQSRYDDALEFNRRLFGRDEEQAGPLPVFVAAMLTAGRNEACPCGSGRKYKQCHQGKPLLAEPQATQSLLFKVARFADDAAYRDQFGPDPDGARQVLALMDDPATRDDAVNHGGFLDRYLSERGAFLPADEADQLREWSATVGT